jgi:AraC-like DNA-binding protein
MSTDPANQDPELLRRLLRARDRMDAASHEEWPVARLAQVSGVSEAHFARSFKQAFGIPPHRYLLTRRIERAMALLRRGDMSVTDVCFEVGCSSLGTFSTRFTELVGVPPSVYRQQAADATVGMPPCVAKQVTRPIRNREAPTTEPG